MNELASALTAIERRRPVYRVIVDDQLNPVAKVLRGHVYWGEFRDKSQSPEFRAKARACPQVTLDEALALAPKVNANETD